MVQATGVVRSLRQERAGARLALDAPDLTRPIAPGASICVSGACLTVTRADDTRLEFDVVPETLSRTTLGSLSPGRRVNLEPSLRAGDPLDGHVVQGHVDGTALVSGVRRGAGGSVWAFTPDEALMPFIIPKGSIAVDGVSLTIAEAAGDGFSVALIPTTLDVTTLGTLRVGERVNLETDILARAVVTTLQRWRAPSRTSPLTVELLQENGW
jgi:riboflavin synthase alpha subunit